MSQTPNILPQATDNSEFIRIDPALIKIEAGGLWRSLRTRDLEALKASIAWRERRLKGSGLLMPLLVSRIEGVPYYKLEDGLRRLRAIQALADEGLEIGAIPVRVLPAPLSLSERLTLIEQGPRPLEVMEEAHLIARSQKQGLSFKVMAEMMNRSEEELKRRAMLDQLTGALAEVLRKGNTSDEGTWGKRSPQDKAGESAGIQAEELEAMIDPDKPMEAQQAKLEELFLHSNPRNHKSVSPPQEFQNNKEVAKDKTTGVALGKKLSPTELRPNPTAWMPKILDPTLHYISLEGLYEWMGGEGAVKHGYSKKVVEMMQLMLKYCGGRMNLMEIAEKLKKL